ncbi:methyltransferase domain-containing protein [Uliginosibacterium flavum]|uniref:Class I SAM-dependent methyltransferase n=1 Tax=Uliginosibacterium flavum TaxID=1396831 RepID=A0ABV2TMT7_9RHOO
MSITHLAQWLPTPRGQYLLTWEQDRVDRVVADIFGFNALQIGLCGQDFLRANRMPHRILGGACNHTDEPGASVQLLAEELPFASQSLDLVVLPHVLEFASSPHQVLRELERVLVPGGHLVITGFNPFSMWGLRRALAGHMGEIPWRGQYLSVSRLKDWLGLLGCEPRISAFGCYAPPASSAEWLRRWSFMDSVGPRLWPFMGGAYVLHAVKRVPGMRLITPKWREQKARKKGLVAVTQKDRGA